MDQSKLPESPPTGFRQKLLTSLVIIFVLMGGLNSYSLIRMTGQERMLSERFDQQMKLYCIQNEIREINRNISSYISSGNNDDLIQYQQGVVEIFTELNDLRKIMVQDQELENSFHDLDVLLQTYREKADDLIRYYQNGQETVYLKENKSDFLSITGVVHEGLEDLNGLLLDRLQFFFTDFTILTNRSQKINLTGIILIIMICSILIMQFSLSISHAIHLTAHKIIRSSTQRILNRTELIEKLKNKESELHQAEHLLKESEWSLLQSQIKPHFLFNTLNVINSLSTMEDAPKTSEMIQNLSELLRYNLLNQKREVSLKEELDLVESYIHIQKTRFGEKLKFEQNVDPEVLNIQVPALILQPLVENAINHGLEPVSRRGDVILNIYRSEKNIIIEVIDNGRGISKVQMDELMDPESPSDSMGIRNVMRRLELKYKQKCFFIDSTPSKGTICRMIIPQNEKPEILKGISG